MFILKFDFFEKNQVPLANRKLTHESLPLIETPMERQNNALCLININRYDPNIDVHSCAECDEENNDEIDNDDDETNNVKIIKSMPSDLKTFDVVSNRYFDNHNLFEKLFIIIVFFVFLFSILSVGVFQSKKYLLREPPFKTMAKNDFKSHFDVIFYFLQFKYK